MHTTDFRNDFRYGRADYFANPSSEARPNGKAAGPPQVERWAFVIASFIITV